MLGRRPGCVVPPESPFKFGLWETAGGGQRTWERDLLARTLEKQFRYQLWDLPPMEGFLPPGPMSTSDVMLRLVAEYATQQGISQVSHWIDHTPRNLRHASVLRSMFPDAHFIHILRDGRGVASSVMPLDWGPNTPEAVARFWVKRVGEATDAEELLREFGVVSRIRFEDLVSDPDESLAELCLEVFGSRPPETAEGSNDSAHLPGYTRGQHKLVGKQPEPSRADAWKTTLSGPDIEEFEAIAGPLLSHMDYEVLNPEPRRPGFMRRFRNGLVEVGRHISNPIRQWRRKRVGPA